MSIRNKYFLSIGFLLLFLGMSLGVNAQVQNKEKQQPPTNRILFIFDASYSMIGTWESASKITIAQRLLCTLLDSLVNEKNLELALRVYGHQSKVPPQDCNDTRLEIPFGKDNIPKIKNRLKSLLPKGTTPIARSLMLAANDFPPRENCRNIIILITDGLEECDGDPCAVSKELQKKGIFLKPFIIGIGITDKSALQCVGQFHDADDEETFHNTLEIVIHQALNRTSAQVNLLDSLHSPSETDVAMTFYDHTSGKKKYNYVHTINSRGNPDTLYLDHLTTYDLVVHTIPPVTKDSITLSPGKHNIIALDAPQGFMKLGVKGRNTYPKLEAIVRKRGEMKTLSIQQFDETVKYLTGKYDIEILTLPRIYAKDVVVSQSKTTTVDIPEPGLATFNFSSMGYGTVFWEDGDDLKYVYRTGESTLNETVLLQPGNYRIVFRARGMKESVYTVERSFKVVSGSSVVVKL